MRAKLTKCWADQPILRVGPTHYRSIHKPEKIYMYINIFFYDSAFFYHNHFKYGFQFLLSFVELGMDIYHKNI